MNEKYLLQMCIGVLFLMITPIFRIFDIEKAHSFYIEYLGFKLDWKHQYDENMAFYIFQISLNDDVIHLSEHHGDQIHGIQ